MLRVLEVIPELERTTDTAQTGEIPQARDSLKEMQRRRRAWLVMLNGDFAFDVRVRVVAGDFDVVDGEIFERGHALIEFEDG